MAINLNNQPAQRLSIADLKWREVVFAALASLILLGPAVPQILGEKSLFLRSWKMYGNAGNGIFKGTFTLQTNGHQEELTSLQVFGLTHYPSVIDTAFINRITAEDPAIALHDFCLTLAPGERLAFNGWRGTRDGWQQIVSQDICRSAP